MVVVGDAVQNEGGAYSYTGEGKAVAELPLPPAIARAVCMSAGVLQPPIMWELPSRGGGVQSNVG